MLLGPATILHVGITRGRLGLSPDSVSYLLVAQTVVREGKVASPLPLRGPFVVGGGAPRRPRAVEDARGTPLYPVTDWPPGYPLAIATVMKTTGLAPQAAAHVVALLSSWGVLVLAAVLSGWLAGSERGLLAAAVVGVLPFFQMTGRMAWSEPVFAVFGLLTLMALCRWRCDPARGWGWILGSAIFAAAATGIRYVGATLYLVILGVIAIDAWLGDRAASRRSVWQLLASAILYPLLILPLVLHNHAQTGRFWGIAVEPSRMGWFGSLRATVASLLGGLIPHARFVSGPADFLQTFPVSLGIWALAAGAGALMFVGVLRLQRHVDGRAPEPPFDWCVAQVLGLFVVTFVLVVATIAALWDVSADTRMLYAVLVCIGILVMNAPLRWDRRMSAKMVGVVVIPLAALATVASLGYSDRFVSWRGLDDAAIRRLAVVQWARHDAASHVASEPVRVEPQLMWILHHAVSVQSGVPADIDRLPELEDLAMELRRHIGGAVAYVIGGGTAPAQYSCSAYRDSYVSALSSQADSVHHGSDFEVWWIGASQGRADSVEAALASLDVPALCQGSDGP